MANTVNTQTIHDGERNVVVKLNVTGDASGEETATSLVDVSALNGAPDNVKIMRVTGTCSGVSVQLLWDATANLEAVNVPDGEAVITYWPIGGLVNNAGTGKTGDVLFTTTGLGAGDEVSIVVEMQKRAA